MGAYILRRLLLIIPTLLGIMLLNFGIIQFVPGGPVEQLLIELEDGQAGDATKRFSGGGEGGGGGQQTGAGSEGAYRGRQGMDPDLIADLEAQFGFARIVCQEGYEGPRTATAEECVKEAIPVWERFGIMMWNYIRFDLGESFARSDDVIDIIAEKMPVSITLGLWATLISYLVSIPLGIRKAIKDGTPFDTLSSGIIIAAYSLPGFLVPIVLLVLFAGGSYFQVFPIRGLLSEGMQAGVCAPLDWTGWWYFLPTWRFNGGFDLVECVTVVAPDYFWHITLPVLSMTIAGFATLTLLTKNSFLDEIKKQYVTTARAKGLSERRVLYRHVFRNAMLIVIAGFPGLFVRVFFAGSIFVETVFNLDGLGLLGFESVVNRDYPVVLGTVYMFGLLGLILHLVTDLVYVWIDPRIDFEKREG